MAFKLIESQSRWRAVNAPHLVALVRAGAKFEKGILVERPDDQPTEQDAYCELMARYYDRNGGVSRTSRS